jgi:osmotically-inducible protein OsmY
LLLDAHLLAHRSGVGPRGSQDVPAASGAQSAMRSIHALRRSPYVTVAVAALAVAWMGCHRDTGTAQLTSAASTSPAATAKRTPIPDADIAQAITRHLKEDGAVRSEHVHVAVHDGICTLSGSVKSLLAKKRGLRVAETLRGVRSVIDQVEVQPVSRTDDQLKGDVMRALQQDAVTRTDAVIVAAKDGKVTLTGVAASWPEKGFFTQLAEAVKGVKAVDNQISVKYALVPAEGQVAADVKHRIANDIWLDGNAIAVTVTGHTVHLKGVVGSVAEKARARSDAWLAGVDYVDDDGVVVDWAARDDQRHVIDYAFRPDDEIARAVRDAFKLDPRLVRLEPRVEAQNGVVELTGTVDSAKARRAAELDARDTVGVADVRNRTVVEPTGSPTDADLDRGVKRALSDDLLLPDPAAIHASASKGKVVLKGKVQAGFERFDAIADVASIPGVNEIVDEMSVERSPQDIKADIDDRLFWDATVGRDRVKVAIAPDSVATLSGTLDSWSEVRAAVDDATLGGAVRVINLLQVRKPAGH